MTASSAGLPGDGFSRYFSFRHDPALRAFWLAFSGHTQKPPCFSPGLLDALDSGLATLLAQGAPRYFVLHSAHAEVFNLGGDLAFFRAMQQAQDRQGLQAYATQASTLMGMLSGGFGRQVTTVALVQGQCFGGGLEAALACHHLFAEPGAVFCFPEIQLGIFPGMGALRILARKLPARHFAALCESGARFSAADLLDIGLVDSLVEPGTGEAAVQAFIRKRHAAWPAHQAMADIRRAVVGPTVAELGADIERWVECVLALGPRHQALMAYAVDRQQTEGAT